jgi:HSP20 family protein
MGNILRKIAGMDGGKNLPMEEDENLYENYQSEDNEMNEEEPAKETEWLEDGFEEGQLSIDVYQTPSAIVVKSTIAGVSSDDIDISINNDMLTIRGKREQTEKVRDEDYLYRECYWGSFSRSIILPVEVEPEKVDASLENGVLTVVLPKAKTSKQISIKVKNK